MSSSHGRFLLIMSVICFLFGFSCANNSDDDQPTMNVCITPRACFRNEGDESVNYCITSGWYIKYPQQLRTNLAHVDSIVPVDYQTIDFDKCGWNVGLDSVSRQCVSRGQVYYKYTNASLDTRPPTLPNDVAPAVNVMQHTYPIVEIMLILLFCVILPFLLALSCCVLPCLGPIGQEWRRSRHRRRAERERRKIEKNARKQARMQSRNTDAAVTWGSGSSGSDGGTVGWNEKIIA